ncbi:short-chain dehydrogenase/reductase [Kibdelosporangium phytohabitans]|uniref:Short-chain dehydrogenase n=1 Tax=Kibdelosporangium phytohabitans TaxID=860235 RepID=A0A0N9I2T1_9PSEU|nr:short-chain dehydrogenase/reductase [Kibdelosporangium phytohabitans]ALG14268.1 short-chain dehydrogenase [Kibdelosporangium phytohabitans]MBE1466725.1 NAD(P)-dependent dehydrogenase (short-subunit alcohol dehydrogenase family) [Kibdelosporangium phytohabitans]
MGSRNVNGKVVLITGAARGIGAGVAKRLAKQGAKLALVGLEPEELKKVAAECGPDAAHWEANVTDWDSLEQAVNGVVAHFGGIDVVVANAGIAATGFVRSIDRDAFERVIEVDLLGVWRTVRVALPHLIERRGYALIVSSAAAIMHIPGNAAYSAAKAGAEAFANSLRAEVHHLGVSVGVAHPTWIATDMVNSADKHPVFGSLRTNAPGLAGKTYPLSLAVDLISNGIVKRARAIHVPGWVGATKLVRALLPRIVELATRGMIPKADKAAIEDIAKRGSKEASIVGPGARADLDARTEARRG